MTIEWLAGNRLRGTTAERPNFGLVPSGSVGGWVEVGRTTLGSNSQTIDITSIPDKRYYMVLFNVDFTNAGTGGGFRLNNDSGTNYSWRYNQDGGVEQTFGTNQSNIHPVGGAHGRPEFYVSYISNLANKEKLCIMHRHYRGDGGATSISQRQEFVGKWTNTSNAINQMTGYQGGSDNFTSGDEIVVLGWDPADEHTSNFWEELASVDLSGGASDTISSGTFTAKKYLWIQCFTDNTGGATRASLRVGNNSIDTGNNYAYRRSNNGAGDGLFTSTNRIHASSGAVADTEFTNTFILNNASKEKLAITHDVRSSTAGAGNAPTRDETVGRWTNTSNQINIVEFFNDQAGDFGTNTILKVWGAD